jgi:phosphatidylserine synthase
MRLARFNAETPSDSAHDHQEFSGLPSPAAAAMMASMLIFFCFLGTVQPNDSLLAWLKGHEVEIWVVRALPIGLVLLGLLMVSRFPYPHVVVSMLHGKHSFPFLASVVVLVSLLALEWEIGLLVLVSIYVLWGLGIGGYRLLTIGRLDRRETMVPETEAGVDGDDTPQSPFLN